MTQPNEALAALDVFVGEWSMEARFEDMPPGDVEARVVFEWLAYRKQSSNPTAATH